MVGLILHEMGHIIGIGTLWDNNNLLDTNNDYRVDTRATNVWRNDWGCVGTPPVEKDFGSGTALGHWDEECLGKELMTGFVAPDPSFSRLTIASVEDIGYVVNYNAANAFDGRNTTCCNARPLSAHNTPVLSDAGMDDAVAYGQKILSENQLPDDVALLLEENDSGLSYVGDIMGVVLYIEDGIIFEVFVTKTTPMTARPTSPPTSSGRTSPTLGTPLSPKELSPTLSPTTHIPTYISTLSPTLSPTNIPTLIPTYIPTLSPT